MAVGVGVVKGGVVTQIGAWLTICLLGVPPDLGPDRFNEAESVLLEEVVEVCVAHEKADVSHFSDDALPYSEAGLFHVELEQLQYINRVPANTNMSLCVCTCVCASVYVSVCM